MASLIIVQMVPVRISRLKIDFWEENLKNLLTREMAEKDYQNAFDELAPGTEQTESETAEEQTVESEFFFILIQIKH